MAVLSAPPELAEKYKALNRNISVCYNAIDDVQFSRIAPAEISGELKRPPEVRVGYAGSSTHIGDLQSIMTPLCKVMRKDGRVKLIFVGSDMRLQMPMDLIGQCEYAGATVTEPGFNSSKLGDQSLLASVRYLDLIRSADLDIQIAPLASTVFNRSKSELKLLEAAILGTTAVCSNFGPYRRYLDSAPSGVPVAAGCSDPNEWKSTLRLLIGSAMMRQQIAQANYEFVRDNHLVSQKVHQWAEAIEKTMAQKAAV